MKKNKNTKTISSQKISAKDLKRICLADIEDFGKQEFFKNLPIPQISETQFGILIYFDMGSNILGIAHLDSHGEQYTHFSEIGNRIYTASLDDRFGAYIITELLSQKNYPHDILLTVGEETANSTAQFFRTEKKYNWMFEFDRGGIDVVMYDYENREMVSLIESYGWSVGIGSFTDICFLDHLGCKGFNFSAGFYDYHGQYAFLDIIDAEKSIEQFINFYNDNKNDFLKHIITSQNSWYSSKLPYNDYSWYDDNESYCNWNEDTIKCPVCKSKFSVDSIRQNIINNVDNIYDTGMCISCSNTYVTQDYIEQCHSCKDTQICLSCDGNGKCLTGKNHNDINDCIYCNSGKCNHCAGEGYCPDCN